MGCGIATNSKGVPAVTASGSSTVNVTHVSAVGGLKATANYGSGTMLLPYSIPQRDPFRGLPAPVLPSCSPQLRSQPNSITNVSNPTGVACYKGMDLKGTVNFAPGLYYVDGGAISISSQARVTGSGVTFILTSSTASSDPGSVATVDINGGATVQLTATTSGTYAGVLFYQDRRANNTKGNTINGNASSTLQGAIYIPSQAVDFSGGSGMRTECVQIVSRRVTFNGNNRIVNECPTNSGAGAFVGTRVYLVG
jgi:hypothetical protein